VAKVLNLGLLTDRKLPRQRRSNSSAAYIIEFRKHYSYHWNSCIYFIGKRRFGSRPRALQGYLYGYFTIVRWRAIAQALIKSRYDILILMNITFKRKLQTRRRNIK
jgi:hypothetical protein